MKRALHLAWRIGVNSVIGISLCLLLALWALRAPWVQDRLIPFAENFLTEQTGAPVHVASVDFHLPGKAVVRDVSMLDELHRPMFSVHELRLNLLSLPWMDWILGSESPAPVRLNRVEVVQPFARLVKSRTDSTWNFAFLIPKPDTLPSKPSRLQLEFPEILVQGGVFQMVDSTRADSVLAVRHRLNAFNLDVRAIQGRAEFNLRPGKRLEGELRSFSALEERCRQMLQELSGRYSIELAGSISERLRVCTDNTRIRSGRTQLMFDGEFADERPDSVLKGFYPAFSANLKSSVFDFTSLNAFLPKPLPMQDPVAVQGYVWGDRDGIHSDSLDLAFMRHTRARTTISLENYTNKDSLLFGFGISRGQISFDELKQFLRIKNLPLEGIAQMKGKVSGNLLEIRSNNLRVSYLKDTDLLVDAKISNYQDAESLFMDLVFKQSHFAFSELRQLLPAMLLPEWMDRFGRCSIDGSFKGGISDFRVAALMGSAFGAVNANLHLVLPPKRDDIAYEGELTTSNLTLAALGADLPVKIPYLNFQGSVKGHGTRWGEIVASISGKATESNVGGYHLDKLETDSLSITKHRVKGALKLRDAQGDASVIVDINLPDSSQKFKVQGNVEQLDLAHYGILPDDSVLFSSILRVNLTGDSLENYTGPIRIDKIALRREGTEESVQFNKIELTSSLEPGWKRNITLQSTLADMRLTGTFSYKNAGRLVERLIKEVGLYAQNNDSVTAQYYASKVLVPENVLIYDTLITKSELNELFSFLRIPMYFEPGTTLYSEFSHASSDQVTLNLRSDSLSYSVVGFRDTDCQVSLFKEAYSNNLIGTALWKSDTFSIGSAVHFADFQFEPSADSEALTCFLRARQPENNNEVVLSTVTQFLRSGEVITQIKPGSSHLGVKGKFWEFDPSNRLVRKLERPPSWSPSSPEAKISRYHFSDFVLRNGNQEIRIEGVVSKDPKDRLIGSLQNVRIHSLMEVFSSDTNIDGRIHQTMVVATQLLSPQPIVSLGGFVDEFRMGDVDSLNMQVLAGWPHQKGGDYIGARALVGHWGQDTLEVAGWYNMIDKSLDFSCDSSTLQLGWIEPFVEGVLDRMTGKVLVDDLRVQGTTLEPRFSGNMWLKDLGFKVNFLNTYYSLSDQKLMFEKDRMVLPPVVIRDTAGGSAVLKGEVFYTGKLNLQAIDLRKFLVMNTRKSNNEVFYGRMVVDGDSARVTGPARMPLLEAWVNSGDGSWLDIPLSSYTSASRLDFVEFIEGGKQQIRKTQKTKQDAAFELALHVNARPNAKVRLIFDEFVGDIIEAVGEGNLNLYMDKTGELSMYGTYEVKEGNYLFTMQNVLNKKFKVQEGGKIIWSGSPYEADLDLNAVYQVNADISSLVPGTPSSSRIPVEIVMHMMGDLYQPEIDLSLALSKLSEQDAMGLDAYFRGITYDQQELNKQVVSLLMFRRFTGSGGTVQNGTSTVNVTSSISELVSNQVNYWISQAFDDPNLGVEINSNEFQDLELVLRANLFNDRVTIERNGTIIGNAGNNFSLGDISMHVRLLPKADTTGGGTDPMAGQLVWEIFNREDASVMSRNTTSQGTGVFFKKDFDRRRDLIPHKRDPMKKEDGPDLEEK